MLEQGNDPADFTEDDYNAAIAELQAQIDAGQIRQVSGNDYIGGMEGGDVVAVIAWSGDIASIVSKKYSFDFVLPESGGTLWTDNMLVPAMALHSNNAERLMNYYYDPKVAAEVAAYVQYICPVEGAQAADGEDRPEPRRQPLDLPDGRGPRQGPHLQGADLLEQAKYDQAFQTVIGN